MAELPRLNGIIKALEQGQVAFLGSGPADAQALSESSPKSLSSCNPLNRIARIASYYGA